MIVADTSALVSLGTIDLLDSFFEEFDVHTTEAVLAELEETATYEDIHGTAAARILDASGQMTIHSVSEGLTSSRVDVGEGSCALLTRDIESEFLITDDLRALPELQSIADAKVAISPLVLKAFVKRDVLEAETAASKLETLADRRDWLGAPIYRRAKRLFD